MKRAARLIVFYAGLIALWTLLAKLKIWPPYLFPTPWGVGEALYAGFKDHSYWIAIAVSMRRRRGQAAPGWRHRGADRHAAGPYPG